jgi:hypothetical protein
MRESTATVAALLSAALACFLNLVRHAVVMMVNAAYAAMVALVMAANCQPYWYVWGCQY